MQRLLIDGMKVVLQRVRIFSFEMTMKIEMGLLGLIFEKPKPGMSKRFKYVFTSSKIVPQLYNILY